MGRKVLLQQERIDSKRRKVAVVENKDFVDRKMKSELLAPVGKDVEEEPAGTADIARAVVGSAESIVESELPGHACKVTRRTVGQ